MTNYPSALKELIAHFRKLPGVGQKSAERYAFQILSWKEQDRQKFATSLAQLSSQIITCKQCGALGDQKECLFCSSQTRDPKILCIVSSPKDIYPLEQTGIYNGQYHVMPGLISPLDGIDSDDLDLEKLFNRINALGVKEVVLALDSTVEGDATSLYLKKELAKLDLFVSRLAMGIPLGSSLEYIDEGTLSKALSSRSPL